MRSRGGAVRRRRRTPPPGARPGTLQIPPGAAAPRLRIFSYDAEVIEERPIADADEIPLDSGRVVWIDVVGFGDEELLGRLRDRLGIHPLALADVVNVPQRPKSEDYGDRHLVVTRMARLTAEGAVDLEQVSIVLGPGWVITFQEHPGDVFEPLRERLRDGRGQVRRMGADYLLYALVDAVIDGYFPVVELLAATVEALEEEAVEEPGPGTLGRIRGTRRLLLELYRVTRAQREAIDRLLRHAGSPVTAPVRTYLRDAHDHATEILELIEAYREMSHGLLDIYLSSASNRTNEVMRTLTVIASIFIPLTFIAGIYGMNFEVMPELGWRLGYPAVLALMGVVAAGFGWWFRRRGWFRSGDDS